MKPPATGNDAAAEPTASRVYALPDTLSPEQKAVVFAWCSRNDQAFDATTEKVSADQAADFHERWVLGYGHASVAEHGVIQLAVENISRLCADAVLSGRLASYTEQSSRYQEMPASRRVLPPEIADHSPALRRHYLETMALTADRYATVIDALSSAPPDNRQTGRQRRRAALDSARGLLPAATQTRLGMTVNARALAYLIACLSGHPLQECRRLAWQLRAAGQARFPTLLRHSATSPGLRANTRVVGANAPATEITTATAPGARLLQPPDPAAEHRIAQALRFRTGDRNSAGRDDAAVVKQACSALAVYEPLPREFELATCQFAVTLDYGALRELRRHRMLTLIERAPDALGGYAVPPSVQDAGAGNSYAEAMQAAAALSAGLAAAGLAAAAGLCRLPRPLADLPGAGQPAGAAPHRPPAHRPAGASRHPRSSAGHAGGNRPVLAPSLPLCRRARHRRRRRRRHRKQLELAPDNAP